MGICRSKAKPPPPPPPATTTATPQRRPVGERLFHRRTTTIHNQSSTHVYISIAPSPVSALAAINIDKVGGLEFNKQGEYLSQAFKVVSKKSGLIKVDSHRFYVGALLLVEGQWRTLWDCRDFSASDDIVILERHIDEAKISGPTAPTCLTACQT